MENDDKAIEQLYWQVMVLNDSMNTLNQMVTQQHDFDTLEDVILTPKQDIQVACTTLVTADHYQSNWYYYTAGFIASMGTTIALLFLL